jgi:Ca2+-binding EF-hand superfamily protein
VCLKSPLIVDFEISSFFSYVDVVQVRPSFSKGRRSSTSSSRNTKPSSSKLSARESEPRATTRGTGFSQSEIDELTEAFSLFDAEGTGRISIGDFRAVLESLQSSSSAARPTYPHLGKLLDQLSKHEDGELLDLDEYLRLMESTSLQHRLQANAGDQDNFAHVFELFDLEGKGYITLQDLERVANELGEHDMTREELEEMMERANSKHNGRVTLQEFTKLMTLNLFQKASEMSQA